MRHAQGRFKKARPGAGTASSPRPSGPREQEAGTKRSPPLSWIGPAPRAVNGSLGCIFLGMGRVWVLVVGMWSTKPVPFVRGVTLAVLAALVEVMPFQTGAVETEAVPGHVPAALARLQPLGRLEASTELHLAVGLPLRNRAALDALLAQLCNPASPNYRHYLTPEQFTERFGPTLPEHQAVVDTNAVLPIEGRAAMITRSERCNPDVISSRSG